VDAVDRSPTTVHTINPATGTAGTFTTTCTATDDLGNNYQVDRIEIAGVTIAPGQSKKLSPGSYIATIYPIGGCDSFTKNIEEDCCEYTPTPITRDCDGNLQCTQDSGVIYSVNGVEYADICTYLKTIPLTAAATVKVTKPGCSTDLFTLRSLDDFCCDNFSYDILYISDALYQLNVLNGTDMPTIQVTGPTNVVVTDLGDNEYSLTNFDVGGDYLVTVSDPACGAISGQWIPGECDLVVTLNEVSDCSINASVPLQSCDCRDGRFNAEIISVVDQGTFYTVIYKLKLDNFDALPVAGNICTVIDGVESNLISAPDMGLNNLQSSLNVNKKLKDVKGKCLNITATVVVVDDGDFSNNHTVEVTIYKDGVNMLNFLNDGSILSSKVTVNGSTQFTPNGNGIYISGNGDYNNLSRNYITGFLFGDGAAAALYVESDSDYNVLENNTIFGGIYLSGNGNFINGGNITSSDAINLLALLIAEGASDNLLENLFIDMGFASSDMIEMKDTSSNNSFINVSFDDSKIADGYYSIVSGGAVERTLFRDSEFTSFSFSGTGVLLEIENSSNGLISFLDYVYGSSDDETVLGDYANVGNNTALSLFSSPMNISLYGIGNRGFVTPILKRNNVDCGIVCENYTSLDSDIVIFRADDSGNYSVGEGDTIPPRIDLTDSSVGVVLLIWWKATIRLSAPSSSRILS